MNGVREVGEVLLVPLPAGFLDGFGVVGMAELELVAIVAVMERARLLRARGQVEL